MYTSCNFEPAVKLEPFKSQRIVFDTCLFVIISVTLMVFLIAVIIACFVSIIFGVSKDVIGYIFTSEP